MDQVTSKIIAGIRFPLICGIVLIHLRIMECSGVYMGNINWYIFRLFSDILGRISVPLFAIISGYLFFVNVRKYDWIAYKQKLYRRLKSILLPYVLWNLLFYLVYVIYLVSTGRLVERYTDGNLFDIADIFLWGSTGKPIDYPLWFMRDLFLLAVLSPLLYLCLNRCKCIAGGGIIIISIVWFFDILPPFSQSIFQVAFFFMLGAYASINKIDIFLRMREVNLAVYVIVYALMAIAELVFQDMIITKYIHQLGILIGVPMLLSLYSYVTVRYNFTMPTFLSESVFFIYAYHAFLLSYLCELLSLLHINSGYLLLMSYFIAFIFVVLLGVGLNVLLKRTLPKVHSLLTGCR